MQTFLNKHEDLIKTEGRSSGGSVEVSASSRSFALICAQLNRLNLLTHSHDWPTIGGRIINIMTVMSLYSDYKCHHSVMKGINQSGCLGVLSRIPFQHCSKFKNYPKSHAWAKVHIKYLSYSKTRLWLKGKAHVKTNWVKVFNYLVLHAARSPKVHINES